MVATKEQHRDELRRLLPEGSTVYWVCRHRSASNMAGWYSFVIITPQGLRHPNYAIGILTGRAMVDKRGYFCIRVNGCGFDRPGSVVGELARELHGRENALRSEGI